MAETHRSVAVVGASGYLGGELVRLLADHPYFKLNMLAAGGSAGQLLSTVRPGLAGCGVWQLAEPDPDAIAEHASLAFLALPHGASAPLAAELVARGVIVIDLGSDFRLREPANYLRYYQREHPAPELLSLASYCLPELTGRPPSAARIFACPGCFATALALAIVPLASHLAPGSRIAVTGWTGSSGAGATPTTGVHHALRATNVVGYKALAHQHLGELRELLTAVAGCEPAVDFVPHSAPLTRGILVTVLIRESELAADASALLTAAYRNAALVSVTDGPVALGSVIGSAQAVLGVTVAAGAIVIWCAIDNLLKGGAGQAVQIANLLCERPECSGLPRAALWP
jgi:N-acetyl-gamma-glutamyl-phosphate reductase